MTNFSLLRLCKTVILTLLLIGSPGLMTAQKYVMELPVLSFSRSAVGSYLVQYDADWSFESKWKNSKTRTGSRAVWAQGIGYGTKPAKNNSKINSDDNAFYFREGFGGEYHRFIDDNSYYAIQYLPLDFALGNTVSYLGSSLKLTYQYINYKASLEYGRPGYVFGFIGFDKFSNTTLDIGFFRPDKRAFGLRATNSQFTSFAVYVSIWKF